MTAHFTTIDVDGLEVFYRSAGDPSAPAVLLLHGFPTASHMFRDLIPELAEKYHVIAPDLPGFGLTERPGRDGFAYSFANMAKVVGRFTEVLGLKRFAVYIFDSDFQAYFRAKRPPLLAVWGRNDPFFLPQGAEAFRRDVPDADIRFVESGHFALETHAREIGAAMRDFLAKHLG